MDQAGRGLSAQFASRPIVHPLHDFLHGQIYVYPAAELVVTRLCRLLIGRNLQWGSLIGSGVSLTSLGHYYLAAKITNHGSLFVERFKCSTSARQ